MNAPMGWSQDQIAAAIQFLQLAGKAPSAPATTVADAWKSYSAHKLCKARPGGAKSTAARMKPVLALLGDRAVSSLSFDDADAVIANRLESGCRQSTAAMSVQTLMTVIRFAVRRRLVGENTLAGYELSAEKKTRDRIYEPREIEALLRAAKHLGHAEIFVIISTMKDSGIRPGELAKRRVGSVDLERGFLNVPASVAKTGVAREVALLAEGLTALKEFIGTRQGKEPLFPGANPRKSITSSALNYQWRRCAKRARIKKNRDGSPPIVYSLRHTTASYLALQLGWAPFQIAAWMGWSNIQQAATYVRSQTKDLQASAAKLQEANEARSKVDR